jgi:PTH1 family peptidyl-tRNA hydrolase
MSALPQRDASTGPEADALLWMAVGLGNPGRRYERTRHNAGARCVEFLAKRLSAKFRRSKTSAVVADAVTDGIRLLLARPTTFMNESGPAVASLMRWFEVEAGRLILVYDDIDVKAETLRLRYDGGTAGHNGLESVVRALGSGDFYRVRIGVGRPDGSRDPADWVLDKMGKKEAQELSVTEAEAADAVLSIIHEGLERAMNRFNKR